MRCRVAFVRHDQQDNKDSPLFLSRHRHALLEAPQNTIVWGFRSSEQPGLRLATCKLQSAICNLQSATPPSRCPARTPVASGFRRLPCSFAASRPRPVLQSLLQSPLCVPLQRCVLVPSSPVAAHHHRTPGSRLPITSSGQALPPQPRPRPRPSPRLPSVHGQSLTSTLPIASHHAHYHLALVHQRFHPPAHRCSPLRGPPVRRPDPDPDPYGPPQTSQRARQTQAPSESPD